MRSIKANDLDSMVYYQFRMAYGFIDRRKISIGAFKTYVLMYEN